jgi:hypothetical protein
MDSGVPFSPSFTATPPMMFMGENPSSFYNGMQNYGTQSMPWVSNHFSHGMSDMSSHFPSSVSPPYANTSFGSGGMMPPSYPSPVWWESYPSNTSYGRRLESSFLRIHYARSKCPIKQSFYLLHSIHLSFFRYVSSYEHFSHGGPPSVLWCFIWGELFL